MLVFQAVGLFGGSDGEKAHTHAIGDFPAFYAAGVISSESSSLENLYSPSVQGKTQKRFFGFKEQYLQFAYPPFVAQFCSFFTILEPSAAKVFYLFFQLTILVISLRYLSKYSACNFWILLAGALAFLPLFSSIAGGQNSIFGMLLVIFLVEVLMAKGDESFVPSLCLGLLCYKPQLAFVASCLLLLGGAYRTCLNATFVWFFFYLVSALKFGWLWPLEWLRSVKEFGSKEQLVNLHQQISLFVLPDYFKVDLVVSLLFLMLIMVGLTFWLGRKRIISREFFSPLLVMFSPHLMYYEASLLLSSIYSLLKSGGGYALYLAIAIWTIVGISTFLKSGLPVQPLILLGPLLFILNFKFKKD